MEYLYDIGEVVNDLKILEPMRLYKSKQKGYLVSSVNHPNAPPYKVLQSSLKQGKGCAYSNGTRIYEGNSLYSNKSLRGNIINIEKSKQIAPFSNSLEEFKCNNCGFVKKMKVKNLSTYGFSCNVCSTRISYPELFFLAYSNIKNIKFVPQQNLEGGERLLFDFVDYENKIVVETHGEQHYKEDCNWYSRTYKSDVAKRKYCEENGYVLIELDCRESTFEFIKNSIDKCNLLPNILEDETETMLNIINKNRRYDVHSIIKDYKNGMEMDELEKEYMVSKTTIHSILKKCNVELNGKNYTGKKVVECITTGQIYDSVTKAAEDVGTYTSNISKAINPNNPRKYAGEINGEKLYWRYTTK